MNQILLQRELKLNDTTYFIVQYIWCIIQFIFMVQYLSLGLNALIKLDLKFNSFLITRYFSALCISVIQSFLKLELKNCVC